MLLARFKCALTAMVLAAPAMSSVQAEWRPLARSAAESRARVVAPFVDDQTIVVARAEVSQISAEKLFEFVRQFLPPLPPEHPLFEVQTTASKFVEDFKQAGGRELYLIVGLPDRADPTACIIAPVSKDGNEKALLDTLGLLPFEVHERIGDVLFAGNRSAQKRFAEPSVESRPELVRALEAAGDTQLQLVIIPSATARRVAEELLPVLPASLGGGPSRTLTRGALWSVSGIDGPPTMNLRMVIQSEDAAAAAMLRAQWRELLAHVWPQGAKLGDLPMPKASNDRLVLELGPDQIETLASAVRPAVQTLAKFSRRQQSTEHLKQIGLAMHTYFDAKKHLPPAAIAGAQGEPLLSWRVAVLPYLGEEALFKEFRLNEAWDSEHNRNLIGRMPEVYRSLGAKSAGQGYTSYVVPVGKGAIFEGQENIGLRQITDGTSNTLMAFEIADEQAVIWTKPDDYAFDPKAPAAGMNSPYSDGLLILFCDGSVHFIKQRLDDETLRRLIVRDDGQPLPPLQ